MELNPPTVSVIVTARDAAAHLDECLRSVTNSTHRDLQIVVVDDGSTDATPDVIQAHAASDSRIDAVRVDAMGRRAALELAHRRAVGSVQCWVDADDRVHPSAMEACLARFDADHQLVYTHRRFVAPDGTFSLDRRNGVAFDPTQILVDNMVFHLRMFTTEVFEASGGVGDLESAIDWDMNLRMTELTTPRCVPKVLYDYRVGHGGQMTGTRAQRLNAELAVRRALERRGLDLRLLIDGRGWQLVRPKR